MYYSLRKAAEETGVDKMTISRAIKSGELSASRGANGRQYRIEASELFRVFPQLIKIVDPDTSQKDVVRQSETSNDSFEIKLLSREIEIRDEQLDRQETDRRRERERYENEIADLRKRLTHQSVVSARLTYALTDERSQKAKKKSGIFNWFQ